MLKTRILTALVLIPLVLLGLFEASMAVWQLAIAGVLGLAAWEWGRLARMGQLQHVLFILSCLVLAGGWYWLSIQSPLWWMSAGIRPGLVQSLLVVSVLGFWLLIVPLWLARQLKIQQVWFLWLAGLLALLPFAWSLVSWRFGLAGGRAGAELTLAVMALVWVADSAAYFAGRAFGRHKLAPAISPGKTWEGVAGAFAGTALYAALAWHWGWLALLNLSLGQAVLAAALLTPLSIMGDLFESWLKRCAGIKDSSQLLPGHGGVLDRVDALLAVLPVSFALLLLVKGL